MTQHGKAKGYPVTNLYTGHYISNLVKFDLLKKNEDGSFLINVGISDDVPLINFAVEQTGGWVSAILAKPEEFIGQSISLHSPRQ